MKLNLSKGIILLRWEKLGVGEDVVDASFLIPMLLFTDTSVCDLA